MKAINLIKGGHLRGANMFQQEKYSEKGQVWNPDISQQDLISLREAGANYVNLSVPGIFDVKTFKFNSKADMKLENIINMASNAGLYVVIAFRTGPDRGEGDITGDGYSNDKVYFNNHARNSFIKMWRYVATKYKHNQNVVGYDLLVEPNKIDNNVLGDFYSQVISAIRIVDDETPIIVEPRDYASVNGLLDFKPLDFKNIVYAIHQYEPYKYTHENNRDQRPLSKIEYIYDDIELWMNKHNEVVIINEFGIKNKVRDGDLFIQKQISEIERLNLSHAAWIWEVEDPDYSYREFDFKKDEYIFQVYKNSWKANEHFPIKTNYAITVRNKPADDSENWFMKIVNFIIGLFKRWVHENV